MVNTKNGYVRAFFILKTFLSHIFSPHRRFRFWFPKRVNCWLQWPRAQSVRDRGQSLYIRFIFPYLVLILVLVLPLQTNCHIILLLSKQWTTFQNYYYFLGNPYKITWHVISDTTDLIDNVIFYHLSSSTKFASSDADRKLHVRLHSRSHVPTRVQADRVWAGPLRTAVSSSRRPQ